MIEDIKTSQQSEEKESDGKKNIIKIAAISIPAALIVSFFTFTLIRFAGFSKLTQAQNLNIAQTQELNLLLKNQYSQRYETLQPLPYNLANLDINVSAKAAILIDMSNGDILYEKNADEVIPPASMTKLFALYVVEEEIAKGRFKYSDIIPLPEESWACNMPPHSSLMFLGKGQKVTLEELLLGLSICSGNDAAYALAYTVSGSMEAFVDRMNQAAADNGLTHTHFVESSGYSEENTTTPREMAAFCRIYISKYPSSLKKYHSVPEFTYPKEKNMAPGDVYGPQDWSNGLPEHITMGITQTNTNPLLGKLEGCDGLKTGYIDESGYNLSLTAERYGTRFLSVTMGGPGNNAREGQAGRIADGTALMETAFSSFRDFTDLEAVKPYFVKVYGSKIPAINLVPAFEPEAECIPFINGSSIAENLENVKVTVELPEYLKGSIQEGEVLGKIQITLGNYVLDTIPLVADRTVEKGNLLVRMADGLISLPKLFSHQTR